MNLYVSTPDIFSEIHVLYRRNSVRTIVKCSKKLHMLLNYCKMFTGYFPILYTICKNVSPNSTVFSGREKI